MTTAREFLNITDEQLLLEREIGTKQGRQLTCRWATVTIRLFEPARTYDLKAFRYLTGRIMKVRLLTEKRLKYRECQNHNINRKLGETVLEKKRSELLIHTEYWRQ